MTVHFRGIGFISNLAFQTWVSVRGILGRIRERMFSYIECCPVFSGCQGAVPAKLGVIFY
jgi:hypothetical protein